MDVDDFLKTIGNRNTKDKENLNLFKIPRNDKGDNIPNIKNHITKENHRHQGDILYLPTSSFGYKYALVIVDVSNSKIDAEALKEKTGNAVVKALDKIYKRDILNKPLILQLDQGSEFKNKIVKEYLKEENIMLKYTLINRHRQNSIVEAGNRRIGGLIMKFQALKEIKTNKQSTEWAKYLPKFIAHLNQNIQKPKKVSLLDDVAGTGDALKVLNIGDKVRKILDYPIKADDNKRNHGQFRAGDLRWSKDIYEIKHIILNPKIPPLYMLNELGTDNIDKSVAYTKRQLQVV